MLRSLELIADRPSSDCVFVREDGSPALDVRLDWWALCVNAGFGRYACTGCGESQETWRKPCQACGSTVKYQGLLIHDFRRSAVRNLVRSGVPEKIAMAITGHITHSTFSRYNIVSPKDTENAVEKLAEYQNSWNFVRNGESADAGKDTKQAAVVVQ